LTQDDILDNITLYWLTNTAISSARFYRENKLRIDLSCRDGFPYHIYTPPRSRTWKTSQLIYYNKLDKGRHFVAQEQPQLFSEDVRAGFIPLRK